jgi:hypothetical protein
MTDDASDDEISATKLSPYYFLGELKRLRRDCEAMHDRAGLGISEVRETARRSHDRLLVLVGAEGLNNGKVSVMENRLADHETRLRSTERIAIWACAIATVGGAALNYLISIL